MFSLLGRWPVGSGSVFRRTPFPQIQTRIEFWGPTGGRLACRHPAESKESSVSAQLEPCTRLIGDCRGRCGPSSPTVIGPLLPLAAITMGTWWGRCHSSRLPPSRTSTNCHAGRVVARTARDTRHLRGGRRAHALDRLCGSIQLLSRPELCDRSARSRAIRGMTG
jgi:hypothetical protein